MRNYIILNGNNSDDITGLLIQSLPPISKPLMRTTIEEIDGRDGDIVTNLGYSAYDKEISIGLYANFDIDEIIKYFHDNQKGQVTFSNEPDKYYNYEIIDQIDFERLIRFRTAIVTLHCQPFKYPTEETPVEIEIQNITNEAEEMALDNTADAPMKLDLKGNTSQASDPTPDSPVDVNVVSGDNTIEICGKNLFDKNGILNNGYINENGGVSSSSNWKYTDYIPIQPNTTYTTSGMPSGTGSEPSRAYYDKNKTFISAFRHRSQTKLADTSPSNAYYMIESVRVADLDTTQIELGNLITTYEEHKEQNYLISLGDIELCNIPDTEYQDYLFYSDGKWYKYGEIDKAVLDGSESYTRSEVSPSYTTDRFRTNINQTKIAQLALSDKFINRTGSAQDREEVYSPANSYIYISINRSRLATDDANGFKEWLSTHNTIVYYVLETPTITEITDENLISQLNNLKNNAKSYDTSTHITQNANDKPFMLNATAVQSGTDTGIVDNEGNIYSKPTLDIEGSGTIAIYLNGNQMFNIDLSSSDEIIIDTTSLEAYNPTTTELMNRQVTGNYDNFKLNVGENTVKISGDLTKATISNYTRWL